MSEANGRKQVAGKRFKVAAISSNTNSFGLNRFVFVARDGEAWAGHKAKQYVSLQQGQVVLLETPFNRALTERGFEIPERLSPDCPPGVVKEIWGNN
jgi:hypothetical protein